MTESPPLARISAAIDRYGASEIPEVAASEHEAMMKRTGVIVFILRSLHLAKHDAESGREPDAHVLRLADAIIAR